MTISEKVKLFLTVTLVSISLCVISLPAFAAEKFRVITSTTIIADIVKNIGEDRVEVSSITAPGVEVHGYQPTPQDIVKASQAKLVLFNGLNLERWLQRFTQTITSKSDIPVEIVSEGIAQIDIVEGQPNPHSWMSFSNAKHYIRNIRDALVKYDPKNKDFYIQNTIKYEKNFDQLSTQFRSRIDKIPLEKRWLVSSEGAFSYLAKDLGFKEAFIWAVNSDQTGTPQQIRDLIRIVKQNKIPVVFSESTVSDEPAKEVAKGSDAQYGGVLYVDSLTEEDGPTPTYIKLLEVTTETIVSAFEKALKL